MSDITLRFPSTVRAADLLEPTAATDRRIDQAIQFLRRELADGSRSSTDVQAAAKSVGIAERTLRRAREALGVQAQKSATSWTWLLPIVGHDDGRPKNMDAFKETKDLLTATTVSTGEDGQRSESGHVCGHVEGQGRKKQNLKDKGLNPSPASAHFSLDEALDLIRTATVKRQARATIKAAFESAIHEAAEWKKITPEAALTWLMGRCLQYYDAVRATWPREHKRYAKKPADFFIDRTWKEEPVIWDRSQPSPKENQHGRNSTVISDARVEELRRNIAAERAAGGEVSEVLASPGLGNETKAERRSVSSLFPNRSQLAPNGHRSGVHQSGTLAKVFSEPQGPDRDDR